MTEGPSEIVASPRGLSSPHRMRLKIVVIAAAWLTILLYVAQTFLPPNVIKLPYQGDVKLMISSVAPQGWAFFTKAPREPRLSVYEVEPDGLGSVAKVGPNASAEFGWGLSRDFMLQQTTAGMAAAEISADKWTKCDEQEALTTCVTTVATATERVPVPAPANHALPCGNYVFAMSEAVPFAWREISPQRERALSAVFLDLTC